MPDNVYLVGQCPSLWKATAGIWMRYDLTDLRLFRAIAEARNLSGGATALFMTASSASNRLKNLEHALGTRLFTRTARGMRLTPAGETLLEHVRGLLADIERMHGDIARYSDGLRGNIRIWANSSSLNGFIVPSVGRFLLAHPDINIDLEERPSQAILAGVLDREVDIGVFAGHGEISNAHVVDYAVDELVVVAPLGHPLSLAETVDLAAALSFDVVCMSRTSSNFQFLSETAKRLGAHLNVRVHGHDFATVLRLVEAGVGVALVPRSVADDMLRGARVAGLRLTETWARRQLKLATRSEKLPAYIQAFLDFLREDPRAVTGTM